MQGKIKIKISLKMDIYLQNENNFVKNLMKAFLNSH